MEREMERMTEAEMMKRLGLEPWNEFFDRRAKLTPKIREVCGDSWEANVRRTGRTTKMILNALQSLMAGKRVFIVAAYTETARNIMQELKRYAEVLDVSTENAVACASIKHLDNYFLGTHLLGEQSQRIFYDHTVYEYPLHKTPSRYESPYLKALINKGDAYQEYVRSLKASKWIWTARS